MKIYFQIVCAASGAPGPWDGRYIKDYTPDTQPDGYGNLETTLSPDEAKMFDSPREALEFWKQQSKLKPLRPDGRPNRPLTAFTVEVCILGENKNAHGKRSARKAARG